MSAITTTRNLSLASDFGKVAYDLYEPATIDSTPVIIQIAHGMIEHKGRYVWIAQELAKVGYIVAVSDHRGHGQSIDSEHHITLGSMGEDGFARASYDLYKLTCLLQERYAGAKVVLLAHSMGSLLARRYVSLYSEALSGLILSGSPAYDENLKYGIAFAKFLRFFGAKTFGQKFLTKRLFDGFDKHFKSDSGHRGAAWICSDPAVVQAYKDDPRCSFMFDMESYLHLFMGMQEVYGSYPTPKNPALPILFISGSDDASGHFGTGVQKARTHLEAQGFSDVGILLYKDARHEVLNEPIKSQVLADILLWLDSKNLTPTT